MLLQNAVILSRLFILNLHPFYLVIIFKVIQIFCHFLGWPILTTFRFILSECRRSGLKCFFPAREGIEEGWQILGLHSSSGQLKVLSENILFCIEPYWDNSLGDLWLFDGIKLNCLEESVKHLGADFLVDSCQSLLLLAQPLAHWSTSQPAMVATYLEKEAKGNFAAAAFCA